MIIRQNQVDTLENRRPETRDDDLFGAIRDLQPDRTERLGEQRVRDAISAARGKAAGYGMETFEPVRRYLDCMFRYGTDFDTDPLLPGLTNVLSEPGMNELVRARALTKEADRHDEAMQGEEGGAVRAALEGAHSLDLNLRATDTSQAALEVYSLLGKVYPQKATILSGEGLQRVLELAQEAVKELRIETPRGLAVVAGLIFALGHKAPTDPLHPWIGAALQGIEDPSERADALVAAAREQIALHLESA